MTEADFYQEPPGYWQQVSDNFANWLGIQHVTIFDVAILLPVLPLMSIGLVIWMPWESWVWKNVPKGIIGAYLLYCAFAFWHFQVRIWPVLFAVGGVVVSRIALKELYERRRRSDC